MTAVRPFSSSPISAMGVEPPGPPPPADLSDTALAYFDHDAIFLNVLEDALTGMFPSGDALIINLLEAGGVASADSVGYVRAMALSSDAALLTFDTASQILSVLKERIVAMDTPDARATFGVAASDSGRFTDAIAAAWSMLLADAGSLADDAAGTARKLAVLADTLQALGAVDGKMTALAAVAVAAALEARAIPGQDATAIDQAQLADAAQATMIAMIAASDAAMAADAADTTLRMLLLASDTAESADDPAATLHALADLGDAAAIYCTLRLGGTDYQGWVLNTDLRAVTEYRNVPFDSFATLGGRTYAAGAGGIYELTGDTDDGAPIDAWFRPFLSNFGTQKMKRATDIWLGTAGANLYVKVHTRDPATGQMAEDIYPVQYTHGTGTDKGRVKVGRGLSSNYWTLTVANVAGADFEISSIEWKPLILDRRQ